jgi:AraC-like DNA-binding protein
MSPSTLHRRLKDEGTSHHQLLDELRADLAGRYLQEKGLAVSEVAFLLGFSEASAFSRGRPGARLVSQAFS